MKRFTILFAVALASSSQAASAATPRADSILAFTGGRQVIASWLRQSWCDANYNPIVAQKSDPGKYAQIMVLNTNDPSGMRCIDSTLGGKGMPFPNRKDGKYIIYTGVDNGAACAWINPSDGSAPRRNLNIGAECDVLSVQYNPATGAEFIYVMGAGQKAIYRIPLTAHYTADMSQKTQVIFQSEFSGGSGLADGAFSVSADGIMAGCALPWPDTRIVNIETKAVYQRHVGMFGCNSNIAPDNSYRFFHFTDDHDGLNMFGPALSGNTWVVPTTANPGNVASPGGKVMGNQWPRWTSNVNYMTIEYPIHDDDPDAFSFENNDHYNWNAAKVKSAPANMFATFCLGKFSADFKSVTWTLIAGGDRRKLEGDRGGMAWVAETAVSAQEAVTASRPGSQLTTNVIGSRVEIVVPWAGTTTASLVSLSGRVVAQASGNGKIVCEMGNQPAGSYVVRVTTGSSVYSNRILVGR